MQMFSRRSKRQKEALAQAHPEEPWLWKKDWASGRIRASTGTLVGALLFAGVWNGFCAVTCFLFLRNRTGRADEQVFWWFIIPFTIVGLGLLWWAGASVLRWRKYGRSVFQMASVPGVIGGQLAGVVRAAVKIEPQNAFRVRLTCTNCTTNRNGDISRNLVWQDEQCITHDLLQRDAGHSAIPVLFQIPYDCRPTDDDDPKKMVYWTLEVTAKTRGLDYRAEFNVPIFKTPQSDPNFVVDRELVAKYAAAEDPERDLRDAGLVRTSSPSGDGCRFVFPMARAPAAATMLTLIGAAFSGVPFLLFYWDAELIVALFFGAIFGLIGLLCLTAAIQLWFYRSVVDVSPRGLTVTGGLFGRGLPRWIETADVAKIETVSRMQSDTGMYYDLIIVCGDGKRVTAGKRLPGHRLAIAVIRQIQQAMGKQGTPVGG
jgi:hypothetical protein